VLWEMLALRPLFEGKSEMALAESVVACKVPRSRRCAATCHAVDVALARALSRSPDGASRHGGVREVIARSSTRW